jgi:hypothetical protein
MATEQVVKLVRDVVAAITTDPIDSLVTNKDWGKINFEGARKHLDLIFSIATPLTTLPLDRLPDADINALRDALTPIGAQIAAMRTFTIEQANATNARDSIVNSLRDQANNLYSSAQIRVPFLAFQRADVRENEAKFWQAVEEARNLLDTAKQRSEASLTEIAGIIAAAREASASAGVAHYTTDFSGAAEGLAKSAKIWLTATAGFGAVTLLLAVLFPAIYPISGPGFQSVQIYTSKLLALGTLITATIWCGRIYKATKHQEMVNRHRANALKTFQAFVKASADEQTRDAVLLETTRSIFALAQSGYLDGGETSGDGIKILEIIKSASAAARQT